MSQIIYKSKERDKCITIISIGYTLIIRGKLVMKKGLLIASRPLANDGLTKIELDVLKYNRDIIDFDLACGFDILGEYERLLKKLGVKIHRLPSKKNVLGYMWEIYKLVKRSKYDFVYIHGNSAMMIAEALPSKIGRIRVLTHCHNTKSNYPFIHHLVKPFFNYLVDVKIGCSILASRWAYCGKRIITIKNGIDIDRFKYSEKDREQVRGELGWKSNVIIGHIGRFNYQKNHKRLIEIFYEYQNDNTDARLLLIGDGELHSEVEKQAISLGIINKIKFISSTNVPEKYMSAMDLFLLPSLFEGLCIVAVEAQANGLPTIIDDFFPSETAATNNVVVLKLDNSNDIWCQNIEKLLQRGRMDCAKQLIDKGYDVSIMMKKIQEVLLDEL